MSIAGVDLFCEVYQGDTDLTLAETQLVNRVLLPAADRAIERFLGYDPARQTISNHEGLGMYSGTGFEFLALRVRPVYSITAVYLDATAYFGKGTSPWAAGTQLTEGQHYVLEYDGADSAGTAYALGGRLIRLPGYSSGQDPWPASLVGTSRISGHVNVGKWNHSLGWERGIGNIRVDYVAGYPAAAMPEDIQLAAAYAAAEWFDNPGAGSGESIKSQRLGDYAVTFGESRAEDMPGASLPMRSRQLLERYRIVRVA